MNISKTTFIGLTSNSCTSCITADNTVNLYLHNQNESIIIQFVPENLPTVQALVVALQELQTKIRHWQIQKLQEQLPKNGHLTDNEF